MKGWIKMFNIKYKVQRTANRVGVSRYELSRGETEYIVKFNNEQDYLIFCWNFTYSWGSYGVTRDPGMCQVKIKIG